MGEHALPPKYDAIHIAYHIARTRHPKMSDLVLFSYMLAHTGYSL